MWEKTDLEEDTNTTKDHFCWRKRLRDKALKQNRAVENVDDSLGIERGWVVGTSIRFREPLIVLQGGIEYLLE
jgi:hypothetical protein